MRELHLLGPSEDGAALVLTCDEEQFRLPLDDRVAAVIRGERTRWAHVQTEPGSLPRPAEIQARIRAGESAEQIAESAGIDVERIRRYEGPILAEREHIATTARATAVRRRDGGSRPEGSATTLEEIVDQRLAAAAAGETPEWDAHRREDGRWVVVARFSADGTLRVATWTYDQRSRVLTAADDDARWLIDDRPPAPRLASVPAAQVFDQAVTEDREPVSPVSSLAPAGPHDRQPAGRLTQVVLPLGPETGAEGDGSDTSDQPGDTGDAPADAAGPVPAEAATEPATEDAPGKPAARASRRRASVPSWDDIVFGTRKRD